MKIEEIKKLDSAPLVNLLIRTVGEDALYISEQKRSPSEERIKFCHNLANEVGTRVVTAEVYFAVIKETYEILKRAKFPMPFALEQAIKNSEVQK